MQEVNPIAEEIVGQLFAELYPEADGDPDKADRGNRPGAVLDACTLVESLGGKELIRDIAELQGGVPVRIILAHGPDSVETIVLAAICSAICAGALLERRAVAGRTELPQVE